MKLLLNKKNVKINLFIITFLLIILYIFHKIREYHKYLKFGDEYYTI